MSREQKFYTSFTQVFAAQQFVRQIDQKNLISGCGIVTFIV